MAKKNLLQRIKQLITGGGSGGGSSSNRRVVNNPQSRKVVSSNASKVKDRRSYLNAFKSNKDDLERDTAKDAWSQTKSKFKADSSKSQQNTKSREDAKTALNRVDKKANAFVAKSNERNKQNWENKAKKEGAYKKATNSRYDVKGAKNKAEELKRRQNVKSRAFNPDTAVKEAEYAMKYNRIGESAARGAVSGASFGASDVLTKYGTKGEAKKAEEVYQKKKSKGAETAGEIAGSLASFALTGEPSKAVVKKVLPRTAKFAGEQGVKVAEKLATTKVVRKAAEKEVANAVKKGLAKEVTEEAIEKVAKQKAKEVVANLGADAAINATTGKIYSATSAAKESDNLKEFGKNFAKNEAANLALSAVATVGAPAAFTGIKRGLGGVSGATKEALKTVSKAEPPKVKVSLNRKRKTDLKLHEKSVDDYIDEILENAHTVEDFESYGFDREIAKILADNKGNAQVAEGVKRGIKKGNIKPLAETLKANEFIPRSRNAELMRAPRSVERVDTSIEGLTKRLDELKGEKPQTDRETRALETKINEVTDRLNRAKWRKEGGADMEAMQKAYRGEYAGFDMNKTTNSYQSDALEGKLKGKTATIVEMSPDEYMERAYRQIFKKPSEKATLFASIDETSKDVAKYAEAMKNGEQFPLPYLDYTSAGQEGRHRALAAKAAGIDRIPVVIIDSEANPKAIIEEVAEATTKAESLTPKAKATVESTFPYEGTPEAEALVRNQEARPLTVDEMAGVDDALPSTNPQQTAVNEAANSLEQRVDEIAQQGVKNADDGIKVNKVSEDTPVSEGLPSGVKQIRNAYDYNNGEKIEDGILTSWNEAWQASKEYSASHAKGEKKRLSKVAVSELNAMDSEAERELRQKLVDSGDLNYEAISSTELYDKVAKQMRDDADRWVKNMIEINEGGALDFRDTPEWQARVQYILGTVDPSADAASEIAYTEAFKLAQNISSKGGQTLNLRRNFVHLTPLGKRDAILDDLVNILYHSDGFMKEHRADMPSGVFDKRNYIRKLLMEDDAIKDGVKKVVDAGELDDVSDAFAELMLTLNTKNPKAGFDVLQEIRYLNMLGNPKTHLRNIFGSLFFSPIRRTSNMLRSAIEGSVAKKYGMDIAKHGGWDLSAIKDAHTKNPTTDAGKRALEAFNKNKNEILGGAKYETQTYKGRAKTKVGGWVDTVADFNSKLLTKEDDFFRQRAFRENYIKSYNRYVKDGVPMTPKVERRIEEEAIKEAQIATFNEYNEFAKWLSNITRKATDANASTGARWLGRGVNAVMPFTKVPANLMKQSINYSPLGIARGFAGIRSAAKAGDAELMNAAIDRLASGLTGSGIFGLGMLLGGTTDWFTTNAGKDDPAAKFKKDRGMQNYSITFKDPETGQGYSFTLDWLVPTSATFFSGVEMANQLAKGESGLGFIGDWATVASRLAEPVMETSMLSGLHGILETMRGGYNGDDKLGEAEILLRETVQSYINSLVPTLMGQAARTAYSSDKQVVGDSDWEYWRNQLKSKTGLAADNAVTRKLGIEPLGADTDVFGNLKNEKKTGADYLKSAGKNFLSPANIQKVDFSEVDRAKLAEYEERVANGEDPNDLAYLFPKKMYKKSFSVAGEDVQMSNKDVSTYNQAKTTGGAEGMRYALENIMFNRRTTNEKGENVPRDDAYTQEMKDSLIAQFDGKSMREVEQWIYSQPEFKNASPAERQKLINGLWTLDNPYNNSTANASRRVGEQAVIKAQGGDVDEYNFKNEVSESKREALAPAIAAGLVTYAQVVDFDRNASKKSYYETDTGGEAKYTYNQSTIMDYLETLDAPEETKEALYDAYYSGKQTYQQALAKRGKSGKSGRRRGSRRRSGGGSSATVKTSVPIKASDFKADKVTYKSAAEGLKAKSTSKKKSKVPSTIAVAKIEPPKVKMKKYEV